MKRIWILFNENCEVVKCFEDKDAAIQYSCMYFEDEELTFEECFFISTFTLGILV